MGGPVSRDPEAMGERVGTVHCQVQVFCAGRVQVNRPGGRKWKGRSSASESAGVVQGKWPAQRLGWCVIDLFGLLLFRFALVGI